MSRITDHPDYIHFSQKLHPVDFEVLKTILNRAEFDLVPTFGFFRGEDFDKISERAINELFQELKTFNPVSLDGEDIHHGWNNVVARFQKKYWGFAKYQEKPTTYREPQSFNLPLIPKADLPKKTLKVIGYKDAFFYIWSVLQAMIITKALILVFGNELAKDDNPKNRIIFGAVMVFSFGTLFLFAWLRRKNPK